MATRAAPVNVERAAEERAQPRGGLRFDAAMVVLCLWFVGGAFLDAWAHNHLSSTLETFFTPWHGVLYSGFTAAAGFLVWTAGRNHARGHPWRRSVPRGYELSLLAVPLFAAGGVGDMLWHLAFGIELGIDAALSPTHLWPAIAAALFVSGPLRAAWHRPGAAPRFVELLPMLLSMALTLSTMTLISQFAHPLVRTLASDNSGASGDLALAMGVVSVVLQAAVLMGLVLLVIRRWALPPGSLALVFTVNATLLSFMRDTYVMILVGAFAGATADILIALLRPSLARPQALRLFAAAVPAIYYLLYFVALMATDGISWTVHAWAGAVGLAAVAGWLLSYLLLPPSVPGEGTERSGDW
ncbi:MAG: hypothetical protein KatS3mg057_0176 [Herpetosiphonaceae bacterium]|nr:MAG: hypothetical protein KatS3mg057_0176 [Herpetosiphonaceae bacterium]